MFSRTANSMALRRMLSNVRGSRKSNMTTAKPEMHVSQFVYMTESKIPKAPTMFSRMANSMALRGMLSNESGSQTSKMAAVKPEI